MAKNKNNFAGMSKEDLTIAIREEKVKYLRMQFNHSVSPLANPIELRFVRRNIARMFTVLSTK
jgi:large subunit ribosomal protein L29